MSFELRTLSLGLLGALSILGVACTSSVGAPACNALAACCASANDPDPSSCTETAMSGELDDAGCGMQLEMLQANGTCPVGTDAGVAGTDAH